MNEPVPLCAQCGEEPVASPIHYIGLWCWSHILVSQDDYGLAVRQVVMPDGTLQPLVKAPWRNGQ